MIQGISLIIIRTNEYIYVVIYLHLFGRKNRQLASIFKKFRDQSLTKNQML